MRLQAYDDNGTMKFRQVSGSQALDSLPVGTTIGTINRTGGVIPNGYLEADGTTFDTAKYPELYSVLGSDTLPELFDHSSQIRYDLASKFSTGTWYTAPKDGIILGNCQGLFMNTFYIYLRAPGSTTTISAKQLMLYNDYNSNTWGSGSSLPISKGWQVYVESEDASSCYFAPYDKHLLIKAATIGISDVSINAVKTALSYSTEETLTGGTWIDGKPIYRKVVTGLSIAVNPATNWVNIVSVPNADSLVKFKIKQGLNTDWTSITLGRLNNGMFMLYNCSELNFTANNIILEYTKQ